MPRKPKNPRPRCSQCNAVKVRVYVRQESTYEKPKSKKSMKVKKQLFGGFAPIGWVCPNREFPFELACRAVAKV